MILLLTWAAAVVAAESTAVIRVNQVGYRPDAPKVAVLCSLVDSASGRFKDFVVRDTTGRVRLTSPARAAGPFGPCAGTWRLDFSSLRRAGAYTLEAGGVTSPIVRIGES